MGMRPRLQIPHNRKPILIVEFNKIEDAQQVLDNKSKLRKIRGYESIFIKPWLNQGTFLQSAVFSGRLGHHPHQQYPHSTPRGGEWKYSYPPPPPQYLNWFSLFRDLVQHQKTGRSSSGRDLV